MRTVPRPRRYVSPWTLTVLRPFLRRSYRRNAWVLRAVGNHCGPVLRGDRRRGQHAFDGPERRRAQRAGGPPRR